MKNLMLASLAMFFLIVFSPQSFTHAQFITVPSTVFGTNIEIGITYGNAPGQPGEWIGLFLVSGGNTDPLSWLWLNQHTDSSLVFNCPATAGVYDFRMFDETNSLVCKSEPFLVRGMLRMDNTFGTNGLYHTDFLGLQLDDWAVDMAIAPDQKIVVAGAAYSGDTSTLQTPIVTFVVTRFLASGQPDPSFGINGKVAHPIPAIEAQNVKALAVQPDGKIIVGGNGLIYGGSCFVNSEFILIRLDVDGTLDQTFGSGGIVFTDFTWFNEPAGNSSDELTSLTLLPDGKILAGGFGSICENGGERRANLARYLSNGAPDNAFGTGGKVTFNPQNWNEWVQDIDPPRENGDGSFFVATIRNVWLIFGFNFICTYKFDANGVLIETFGDNGVVVDSLPQLNNSQFPHSLSLGPDGQLYLMGCTGGAGWIWLMKKDAASGDPIIDFGNNGYMVFSYPLASIPTGMAFLNNRLVVGHHTISGYWSASRFFLNGEFDQTYGWPMLFPHEATDVPLCCAFQPNGNIVMGGSGYFAPRTDQDMMVIRCDTSSARLVINQSNPAGTSGCFESNESLYFYNYTVESNSTVHLTASASIHFYQGTTVQNGGYLEAQISQIAGNCMKEAPMTSVSFDNFVNQQIPVSADKGLQVKLYPNPASEVIYLECYGMDPELPLNVKLFNVLGKCIRELELIAYGRESIVLTGFSPGVYILTVQQGSFSQSNKVIRQ